MFHIFVFLFLSLTITVDCMKDVKTEDQMLPKNVFAGDTKSDGFFFEFNFKQSDNAYPFSAAGKNKFKSEQE